MIVYHGSNQPVESPDVLHSRPKVDFGAGFYVTPLWEQAVSWAGRYKKAGQNAFVTEYSLEDEVLILPRTLRFDAYNEEWLDFIIRCRNGEKVEDWDVIMGGVANDRVFDTIQLFFDGLIDKSTAIERLKYHKPSYQICLRTQAVIDQYLHFSGSREI